MNKIEKLIYEHCPDGVEFKALGEVTDYVRGLTYNKKDETQSSDGLKVLRANNISLSTNMLNFNDVKIVSTNVKVRENQKLIKNDILISVASGSKTHVGKVAYIEDDLDYYFGGFMAVIRTNLDIYSRFLFHLLIGETFSKYLEKSLSTTTINNLSASIMKAFQIPIPPLPIQKEIVNILDKFTKLKAELEVELEAELKARKKQYEYYREKLLSFGGLPERGTQTGDVEWKTLGEIGEIIRGNGLQKKDFTETGVGCIHYGQIYTYYGTFADTTKTFVSPELSKKLKKAQKGDVLIAGVSENIEDVCKPLAWLGDEICISGDMFVFRHNQNTKFITYLLQTNNFQKYKKRHAQGAKVTRVKSDKILKFKIPIPPLSKQKEIVAILDKFDALVNDISIGLPAEIAARKKQYEYYRNKLLTFQPIINNQKNESQSKK